MPKVKSIDTVSKTKAMRYRRVWGNIEKYCSMYRIDRETLAHIMHLTTRSVLNRQEDPTKLSIFELYSICDALHLNIEDLFE